MSDTQLLTIAIAITASLGALLWNDSRISHLRSDMGKHLDVLNDRFDDMNRHIDDSFALTMARFNRLDDSIARQCADVDSRVRKLENPTDSR